MNIDCKQTPGERHLGGCERRCPLSPRGARSPAAGRGHTRVCTAVCAQPCMHSPACSHTCTSSPARPPSRARQPRPGPGGGSGRLWLPPPGTCRGPGRRQLSLYSWWVIMGLSPGGEHHKRNTFHLQVSPSWPPTLVLIPFLERGWGEMAPPPALPFYPFLPQAKIFAFTSKSSRFLSLKARVMGEDGIGDKNSNPHSFPFLLGPWHP